LILAHLAGVLGLMPPEQFTSPTIQEKFPFPFGQSLRSAPAGLFWPPSLRSKPFRFLGKGGLKIIH
jgi:hypothetical protein